LIVDPNTVTVGASGAIFGLMAAVIIVARGRGVEQLARQFGIFILLNLFLTFSIAGISIGGHIGGLIAGGVAGLILVEVGEKRRRDRIAYATCLVLAAVLAVAAVGVARSNVPGLAVL